MSHPRFLIDTNVFIGLEDDGEINPSFSSLLKLASKYESKIYVHDAARDDFARDKDLRRRAVSLSKFEKFESIPKVMGLSSEILSNSFGELRKPNDVVDATLLHTLQLGVVDFLITEDRKLHQRALRTAPELADRMLFVADAIELLRSTFEAIDVPIRYVEDVKAHTIPSTDPIFESLKDDYGGFDKWWQEKCVKKMRDCWIVSDGGIAGIIVRKDESCDDTDATLGGKKILKICTFKVSPENRGLKLGELFLKQVLWFTQNNSYDLVYLTTFPKQVVLIELLTFYGFQKTKEKADGECIFEKVISRDKLKGDIYPSAFEAHRLNYPRFIADHTVQTYGVPIKEEFHDVLFPDLKDVRQADMFEFSGLTGGSSRPGNTIRKVYLSRSSINLTEKGSLLLFYKGVSIGNPSQSMTAVGVFESMELANNVTELMQRTAGRSVYTERQLNSWFDKSDKPVKVIDFLLAGYFTNPVPLIELQELGIMKAHPNQSIFKIPNKKLLKLRPHLNLGFAL